MHEVEKGFEIVVRPDPAGRTMCTADAERVNYMKVAELKRIASALEKLAGQSPEKTPGPEGALQCQNESPTWDK